MPEELKIVVSAPGAEQTTSALRKLHQAERELSQAIGAAAKAEAADVNKAAAAKKGAAAAAGELTMRHKSLLREMAMLSPECGAAAQAINAFQMGLTGAALGLSLVGVGIMALTSIYARLGQAQAAEKQRIEEMTAALRQQAEVYGRIVEGAEKAARTRRGAGIGAGAALSERAMRIAPPGVGPEAIQRASALAAVAGRGVSDYELQALMMGVTLGQEPEKGTDRAKARRMLAGMKYEDLWMQMGKIPTREARKATAETVMAGEALTPRGEVVDRMELAERRLRAHPEWNVRALAGLMQEIKEHPERGGEVYELVGRADIGRYGRYRTGTQGPTAIEIIERRVFQQGVIINNQDRVDPAGAIRKSSQR